MGRKKKGELPSGSVRRTVFVGYREDGRKRYEAFVAPTATEAEAMASEFRTRLKLYKQMGMPVDQIPKYEQEETNWKNFITLGDAIDMFVETCRTQNYSPSTIPAYISIRKNAFPELMERPIEGITVTDIQTAINYRSKTHSVKTVRNEFFLLKKVMAIHCPELNLSAITIAKQKKKGKLVFPEDLAKRVLSYAEQHECTDYYIYCSFTISAGLRPSEVYALTWEDVSETPISISVNGETYEYGIIDVSKATVRDETRKYVNKATKTEAGVRTLTVDWAFFQKLYTLKKRQNTGRIVTTKPNMIYKYWGRTRKALELPEQMRFYDLRHYYATMVATSGATEDELASRMGHSTSAFSHAVYVELFADRQQKINASLASKTRGLYTE